MRILKWAFETAEQAKTDTQPTNHGMSRGRLNDLTRDVSMSRHRSDRTNWDIRVSGEKPDNSRRRP